MLRRALPVIIGVALLGLVGFYGGLGIGTLIGKAAAVGVSKQGAIMKIYQGWGAAGAFVGGLVGVAAGASLGAWWAKRRSHGD